MALLPREPESLCRVFRLSAVAAFALQTSTPGRDTTNATDSIFQAVGQQGLLALTKVGGGYTGTLILGAQA